MGESEYFVRALRRASETYNEPGRLKSDLPTNKEVHF